MLEDRATLYTLGLVAFLLLAVISFNNMKAKEEAQRGPAKPAKEEEEDAARWLSKFAVQNGSVVGETVSLDGDRLILKQAGIYKLIPLSAAKLHGDEVVVGDVDWPAAIEAGDAWRQEHTKGQDDQVTSELTKSEDVKAPALEAMKARQDDEEE